MSNFDKMADKYKTIPELKAYCNAQYATIGKLNKKINALEKDLKESKENKAEFSENTSLPNLKGLSDEEAICIMELNKLRQRSTVDELNMEECRKVEAYVRTLLNLRDGDSPMVSQTGSMSTEDLLKAMDTMKAPQSKAD